ncbi:hypothetical protein GCM10023091_39660 [Ravibacter arvi]|uniref:DUF4838 domain-containing protein n=1 Tax=Ravibacter arvi TaxID=2051041 RepID=A0ABP8MB74_9BACT
MQRILLVTVLLYFFQLSAHSQQKYEQPAVAGQWIKSWLLCGPIHLNHHADESARGWYHSPGYETDYLKSSGGEENLRVKAGDVVNYAGGQAVWKLASGNDSIIDLRSQLSKEAPVLAYAYAELVSDKDQTLFIVFGTNDGGTLFVNGKPVWDHITQRSLRIDGDWVPIALKKGRNQILFKIEQLGNKWEFCARLAAFSVDELSKRENFFSIEPLKNGQIKLNSPYHSSVLSHLIREVSVKIENAVGKTVVNTTRTQGYFDPISLSSPSYQPYHTHFDVVLKTGERLHYHQKFSAGIKEERTLFSKGRTDYTIALASTASPSEKWAADELRHWLKEISNADFPIVPLDKSKSPRIIVGYNPEVGKKTGVKAPADGDETYWYTSSDADILIYGGKQRGTLYGVMSFLENELGCRWYTPTVSVVPKRSELKYLSFGHSERAGIRVRNDFYYEAFDPVWAARNKMNGSMGIPDQPGGVESYWSVHTFYPLVPPEEFFEKHPEYYSLLEGKRVSHNAQLCLSNPEVLAIVKERIKKKIRENPGYLIYDVSQNDYYNPCECDKCQAIVKREGSESGIMIWFVNQVAEEVEKEFPDKFIGTLAYQYTRSAPRNIKPRNNVVVRFCSIECCFAHDFESCPQNKSFMDDLTAWSRRAPHLYIWDYVVSFSHYLMPFPNFAVLKPNIKTFRNNKSIGIMEQAAYQSRGAEFAELRAYVISKLLWNPDIDEKQVIDDFMYGYYGRAGEFVRKYFDNLQALVKPDTHMGIGLEPVDRMFSDKFVEESLAIFDEAYKVADNDEIIRRIDLAALPALYLKCRRTPSMAVNDGSYDRFNQIVEREGITHLSESGKPATEAFHNSMKSAATR